MNRQPGKVRPRRDSDTEHSWGYRTDARLQWVMTHLASLPAPVWQVMMVLIKYADETGRTFPAVRTIGDALDLAPSDVELALADAEALGLIQPDGISDYGTPTWTLQEGQLLPDPLPLFTKAVTDKVRDLLRYIGPLEYILLEAMIDIGYRWADNTIHTTSKQLRSRLPGLQESQLRDCLHRLCATPYVTRLKQGYGNRPSVYQLELSEVARAARSRPSIQNEPADRASSATTGKLSGNKNVTGEKSSGNKNVTAEKLSGNKNVTAGTLSGNKNVTAEKLSGDNKAVAGKLSGNNSSDGTPVKEPAIEKPTIKPPSSSSQLSSQLSGDDDDETDRIRFLTTLSQSFRETVPGAPGVWRKSYAASALTIVQPYRAQFGYYPTSDEVDDLLARCAAYAARTWAYVAQALSDWVDDQVGSSSSLVHFPSDASRPPEQRAAKIWQDTLKMVRPSVTRPLYDTFLSRTTGLYWDDGVFTIEVPNQAVGTLIQERLHHMLVTTLHKLLEVPVSLEIQSAKPDDQSEEYHLE